MKGRDENSSKEGRSRPEGLPQARELLEEAHALARQIERLLNSTDDPPHRPKVSHHGESEAFRIRLARAHTLSLLDQLTALLTPPAEKAQSRSERDEPDPPSPGKRRSTSYWR